MDPSEVFGYVTDGIKWLAIGGASYLGALSGTLALFSTTLSRKRIRSQEELNDIVDSEARKLGLDSTSIISYFHNDPITGARKNGKVYELLIRDGYLATDATVRHELYHILKDVDNFEGRDVPLLYYLFVAEPRAALYGCFGIKLDIRKLIPTDSENLILPLISPALIPFKLAEGFNDGRGLSEVSYGHPSLHEGPYGITRDMGTDPYRDAYTIGGAAIGETLSLPFYWVGRGLGSLYRKVRPR